MTAPKPRRPPTINRRSTIWIAALALAAAALQLLGTFDHAEHWTEGLRTARPLSTIDPAESPVVVLAIDDAALERFGPWSTWPRDRTARVINLLKQTGASVVGLDILFAGNTTPDADAALINAIADFDGVVIAATPNVELLTGIEDAATSLGLVGFDESTAQPWIVRLPVRHQDIGPTFGIAVFNTLHGTNASINDFAYGPGDDFVIPWPTARLNGIDQYAGLVETRSINLALAVTESTEQAARAAATLTDNDLPAWRTRIATDDPVLTTADEQAAFVLAETQDTNLTDLTDREATIATAAQAWTLWRTTGQQRAEVARQQLRTFVNNRAVLIGWAATGAVADHVNTPIAPRTPGVIVHAAVARGEHANRIIATTPALLAPIITIALALAAGLLALATKPAVAWSITPATLAAYITAATFLLITATDGLLLPLAAPTIAALTAAALGTALRSSRVGAERDLARRELFARLSPELARPLLTQRHWNDTPQRRRITAVFFDLEGFSAMTASRGDEATLALLNKAMHATATAVRANGGYVNKFLGDGLLALFNAPADLPDHETHALNAVRDACQAVANLNAGMKLRAGVATGEALVGDCGAPPELRDYTAIGKVVNDAANLEKAAKALNTQTLIAAETWRNADHPQTNKEAAEHTIDIAGAPSGFNCVALDPA